VKVVNASVATEVPAIFVALAVTVYGTSFGNEVTTQDPNDPRKEQLPTERSCERTLTMYSEGMPPGPATTVTVT
jgi:hypothetical protein